MARLWLSFTTSKTNWSYGMSSQVAGCFHSRPPPDRPEQPSFASVNTVVFSPDGSQIVVTDNDIQGVGFWNFRERSLVENPQRHELVGLSFSGDGRWLVTLSSQKSISVFNATTLERVDFTGGEIAGATAESPSRAAAVLLANWLHSLQLVTSFTSGVLIRVAELTRLQRACSGRTRIR